MNERGYWVTLEGVDAVGKTRQLSLVAEALNETLGLPVVTVTEFSDTPVGDYIREVIKSERFFRLSTDDSTSVSETVYLFTDRILNVETVVVPSISNGKIVISDRGILSLIGYQSQILKESPNVGSPEKALDLLAGLARLFPIVPDLNIILTCPIDVINKRVQARGEAPLEEEDKKFLWAVNQAMIQASETGAYGATEIVNTDQDMASVTEIITNLILCEINEI